jgi:tetratricopeptide (TPR) repeat protein
VATRREKVLLELEDHFTTGMARAAAATAVLDKNLDSLSGTSVETSRSSEKTKASVKGLGDEVDKTGTKLRQGGNDLNQYKGRLGLLIQAAATLGPALVPIGAAGIPMITGLAGEVGALAGSVGVAVLAFQGMGDALKALNDYQAEPTAENLQAMRIELEKLGPDGAHFIRFLDGLEPQLRALQMTARAGLLPGVEEGITSLLTKLPQARQIVSEMAQAMGELAADAGAGLAGPKFRDFFQYLDDEAAPILESLGRTVGNFASGLAQMLVEFAPLSAGFTGGLEHMSEAFADWSQNLDTNQSFQDFLDYVERSGPKVIDLLGALIEMLASIASAAAPVGDVVVPALTAMAKAITAVADSDLGPWLFGAAAALSVYSRAAAVAGTATERLTALSAKRGLSGLASIGPNARTAAVGLGMLALAYSDVDNKAGLSNTAMLGLAGTTLGPWGAAAGAGVGAALDLAHANDGLRDSIEAANRAMENGTIQEQREKYRTLRDDVKGTEDAVSHFWDALSPETNPFDDILSVGTSWKGLGAIITGATDAGNASLDKMKLQIGSTDAVTEIFAGTVGMTAEQLRIATGDAQALSGALARLEGWLDKRAAMRNYQESLDELRKSLNKNDEAWDQNTAKGRERLELLDNTTTGIMQLVNATKSKELKADILASYRSSLVDLQKQFPGARAAILKVIRELDDLGLTHPKPKIDVDDTGAKGKIRGVGEDLDGLDKKRPNPKLDADDKPARNKINSTDRLLGELIGRPYVAKLGANADPAIKAARLLKQAIENIPTSWVTSYSVHRLPTVSPMGSGTPVPANPTPVHVDEEVAA